MNEYKCELFDQKDELHDKFFKLAESEQVMLDNLEKYFTPEKEKNFTWHWKITFIR